MPFCITVDDVTPKENTVTIRDRDTWKQKRLPIDRVTDTIDSLVRGSATFASLEFPEV